MIVPSQHRLYMPNEDRASVCGVYLVLVYIILRRCYCVQSLSGSVSCDIIPSPATATQSKQSKETGNWRKVVK